MRLIIPAVNDKAEPVSELHVVERVEGDRRLIVIERGSLDYVLDERAEQLLADMLARKRGVIAPLLGEPAVGRSEVCGFGWADEHPAAHRCKQLVGVAHGGDHVCQCWARLSVAQ